MKFNGGKVMIVAQDKNLREMIHFLASEYFHLSKIYITENEFEAILIATWINPQSVILLCSSSYFRGYSIIRKIKLHFKTIVVYESDIYKETL